MLKVVTLVGTRPELIKLSLVINAVDRAFKQVFVHTGQNHDYELSEVFFRDLGLREPDRFLEVAESTPAKTIANVIERFDEVLADEAPDAMLLLGDTNSGLAVIAAKRRKIPIFHMEAGNRCFDQRVPEEINRKIIDHTSDINLVYTEHARRYLLNEGIRPDTIIKTGSPMIEVMNTYQNQITESIILKDLGLAKNDYFIVSAHREENVDSHERLSLLIDSLKRISKQFAKRIIFSVHPRTRIRLQEFGIEMPTEIDFMKPMGFFDYVRLQKCAYCVISDSGTLTEESSILGFPAVMIRDAHERPEGMDEGTLIMSDLSAEKIANSIEILKRQSAVSFSIPPDYQAENVAEKVVRIIQSYTDFVDRVVWSK